MKIYLVENIDFEPGRIYEVFAQKHDAENYVEYLDFVHSTKAAILERRLVYGQSIKNPYYRGKE